jgi:hypothetical protein
VTCIVNNILYAIDALEKTIQILDKLSISFVVFFSFGKISCKTFNSENKSISSRPENYHVLKNFKIKTILFKLS